MAKMELVWAIDFAKKKGIAPGRYSFRRNGEWYLVKFGSGYSNTYKVTEFSPVELDVLEKIEDKSQTKDSLPGPPDRPV